MISSNPLDYSKSSNKNCKMVSSCSDLPKAVGLTLLKV